MIDEPMQIPIDQVGGHSRLFLDYVSKEQSPIRDILGGFGRQEKRWRQAAPDRGRSDSWLAVADRLLDYNQLLGADAGVIERLAAARDGRSVSFVVTGQQPGALGGPLLALYKLATAVGLAAHVERTSGEPCIALYWVGSDDVDFREIRDLFLVDCDLTPLSTSIDQASYRAASPVGDIPAQAVERVWESVAPLVASCPHGGFVDRLVTNSIEGAADHGTITARILSAMCGGRAAMVDGREASVRVYARDLFLEFFDREPEIRDAVETAGRTLESEGYHAQLWLGPDSGAFLVEGGRRKKITEVQRERVRQEMADDVTRFSPGVALRNLIQDHVFQPTAVVLGPAEIAYRVQLDAVYRALNVARPVAFPRMHATYLTKPVAGLPSVSELGGVARLLSDPSAFVREVYEQHRSAEIDQSAERFQRVFEAESASFLQAGKTALDDRALEKTRKRLVDLSRRLGQTLDVGGAAGKAAALEQWPFLGGIAEFVRRNDRDQDRYLSALTPFVFGGTDGWPSVSRAATEHIEGALDGTPSHVVYC
jgi:uncharacterized protein YllA (UPF0747 family)